MLKRKNPFAKEIISGRKEMESEYKSALKDAKKALEEMRTCMQKLSAK